MVEKAKELCEDLIANVKEQYEEFKSRPPRYGGDRHGGDRYGGDRYNGGGDRNNSHGGSHGGSHGSYGGSHGGYGGYGANAGGASNSPAPAGVNSPTNAADYAAQYAQYYGSADPYAAYGGYAKSVSSHMLSSSYSCTDHWTAMLLCTNSTTVLRLRLKPKHPVRLVHLDNQRHRRLHLQVKRLLHLLRPARHPHHLLLLDLHLELEAAMARYVM